MAGGIAQWCGAPSSGPLCFHSTEALLWLRDSMPPSLLQAVPWGSVSSAGPSQGDAPWLPMPNTAILNLTPCIVQAGQCALVLCPPLAGRPPPLWLQGQSGREGVSPPTLPSCGCKAAGQCKLGSPGPARPLLLLHSQECQRLLRASCAAGSGSLLQGAAAVVLAPLDGRTHLQESGQVCVLNARHSTGLPSPCWGTEPHSITLINGLVFV